MSLASIYMKKAIEDQAAVADMNVGVFHAWSDIWHVAHTRNGVRAEEPLIFNPVTNLHNARLDGETLGALLNIATCNEVYKTRVLLCMLPCELMLHRPRWQVIRDPVCAHLTLCERCAHNMLHHYEAFTTQTAELQQRMREAIERAIQGCTIDDRGSIVFKPKTP